MSVFKAPTEPPVVVQRYKIIRHVGRTKDLFLLYNVGLSATAGLILELQLFEKPRNKVADVTFWSKHHMQCSLLATIGVSWLISVDSKVASVILLIKWPLAGQTRTAKATIEMHEISRLGVVRTDMDQVDKRLYETGESPT